MTVRSEPLDPAARQPSPARSKPAGPVIRAALAVLLGAGLSLGAMSAPVDARPFSYEDLISLNRVSDPQVSPDGRHVAYAVRATDLANNRGVVSIWLADLNGSAEPRRLAISDGGASHARWSSDGHLYFISSRSGRAQVWRSSAAGTDPVQVTDLPVGVQTFRISPDGRRIAVGLAVFPDCETLDCTTERDTAQAARPTSGQVYDQLFVRHWDVWKDGKRNHVFVQSIGADGRATGEPQWATRGFDGDVPSRPFGGEEDFIFTPDSQGIVFSGREAGRTEPWSTNFDLFLQPLSGGERQNLTADNPARDAGPAFSPDGRYLAYRAMSRPGFESDRYRIMVRDMRTGAVREVAADWDRSAGALRWSRDGRQLFVTAQDVGQTRLFSIDVSNGQVVPITGPGQVSGFDLTPSGFVFAHDQLDRPADLFVKTYRGREMPRQITSHNAAELAGVEFGEYEQFTFSGWNGGTVHGYVVRPANYVEGQRYPVAFLIHGGPQGSFGNFFHYRWNAQTYAGRGYAVVMIDFHGSTGYGQAFTDAISGHWADRPLEDLQRGWAHALSTYDFLDGDRACALGASYGGYMVNWIAGNWGEPWRCLVNHDGVFDTRFMGYSTEELWFTEWEFGGTPWENPEGYERFNPVNHVGNWTTPMLVIQGGLDFRVPTDQSIGAFTALQRRGIESRFLYFPDENHWVLRPQNSLQWHGEVMGWLDRYLQQP